MRRSHGTGHRVCSPIWQYSTAITHQYHIKLHVYIYIYCIIYIYICIMYNYSDIVSYQTIAWYIPIVAIYVLPHQATILQPYLWDGQGRLLSPQIFYRFSGHFNVGDDGDYLQNTSKHHVFYNYHDDIWWSITVYVGSNMGNQSFWSFQNPSRKRWCLPPHWPWLPLWLPLLSPSWAPRHSTVQIQVSGVPIIFGFVWK